MGSKPDSPPLVSVVITVRNEASRLAPLLDSLLAQAPPFEVVLVDAESRDGTYEIAQEYAARHPGVIRVFRQPCSRGMGRNAGVAAARGEYVAFTDGDCFADSNWVARIREGLSIAPVVAGQTVMVGRPSYSRLVRIELFQSGYDVTYPSCNLAYHRALFEQLGGFDPRFITAEDIDLNLRAVQLGASILYRPDATIYHYGWTTFLRFLYQAFWNGYGRKQLTEKHGSLWGRYRIRRLISGQRGPIAWCRLLAALAGYGARVVTASDRRLTNGAGSTPANSPP